jgi:FkbM family methyltransferase
VETLYINGNYDITDISAVASMKKLKKLDCYALHNVTDITPLKDLTSLEDLYLRQTGIDDISILKNLTNLTSLSVADLDNLRDISVVKNFKKLQKYVDTLTGIEVKVLNSAVYKVAGEGEFISSGNRNSSISSTSSYEHKNTSVSLVSIDSINEYADYIKYDVEGGELDALIGSESTIEKHHPTMLVSLYHRSGDIFNIVNYLHARFPFYKMKLRRLRCVPAWEVDLLLFDA